LKRLAFVSTTDNRKIKHKFVRIRFRILRSRPLKQRDEWIVVVVTRRKCILRFGVTRGWLSRFENRKYSPIRRERPIFQRTYTARILYVFLSII